MSSSVVPLAEVDESTHNSPNSTNGASFSAPQMPESKPAFDMSRQGTPLNTVEEDPEPQSAPLQQDDLNNLVNGELFESPLQHSAIARTAGTAGPIFRRARSATMMEIGPYPQKSHSCPIPTCGRLGGGVCRCPCCCLRCCSGCCPCFCPRCVPCCSR